MLEPTTVLARTGICCLEFGLSASVSHESERKRIRGPDPLRVSESLFVTLVDAVTLQLYLMWHKLATATVCDYSLPVERKLQQAGTCPYERHLA